MNGKWQDWTSYNAAVVVTFKRTSEWQDWTSPGVREIVSLSTVGSKSVTSRRSAGLSLVVSKRVPTVARYNGTKRLNNKHDNKNRNRNIII